MKRFIAVAFSSFLFVAIASSTFEAPIRKADVTPSFELGYDHLAVVYINDAVSPAVAPLAVSSVYMFASNEPLSGSVSEVEPTSNSPPGYRQKGET